MTDAEAVARTIEAYNDAWNRQDVDAIDSMHAPDVVFHNHTVGERVEGSGPVREHIAGIFRNTPSLRFTCRRLYVRDGLAVNEWTARAERGGKRFEWERRRRVSARERLDQAEGRLLGLAKSTRNRPVRGIARKPRSNETKPGVFLR